MQLNKVFFIFDELLIKLKQIYKKEIITNLNNFIEMKILINH